MSLTNGHCYLNLKRIMDNVTPSRRSEIMGRVRSRDTKPEMIVRRLVFAMGYRYRLHGKDLPGKPDLVFRGQKKVIFVHGCFWHRHPECSLARLPKSREEFWLPKLDANRQRDIKNERALLAAGWSALTIWECELVDLAKLETRIKEFLNA
jgi:DNA mismatch endonuclease (patch repair protein)